MIRDAHRKVSKHNISVPIAEMPVETHYTTAARISQSSSMGHAFARIDAKGQVWGTEKIQSKQENTRHFVNRDRNEFNQVAVRHQNQLMSKPR